MRYQVRLHDGGLTHPIIVEATEFHSMGNNGVTFFSDRMRPTGGMDQWGNPRMQRQRMSVAFFNNVESVVEAPLENPGLPEVGLEGGGFEPEAAPFDTGWPPENPIMVRNFDNMGIVGRGILAPEIAIDDDGVNWDTARTE